jgi:hypothetical protein
VYPEEKLTQKEMSSGLRGPDLAASITKGIHKAKVVVNEMKAESSEEEEDELSDPMKAESEGTYLQEFEKGTSQKDTAMKEPGDDWL